MKVQLPKLSGRSGVVSGFVLAIVLVVFVNGCQRARQEKRIAETRSGGLASVRDGAVGWDPQSLWRQSSVADLVTFRNAAYSAPMLMKGDLDKYARAVPAEKEIIRKAQLELTSTVPLETLNAIRAIAERSGGEVVNATSLNASEPTASAEVAIRVPAERLDAALTEIRKLSVRLLTDKVEAVDVTKQYIDTEAKLQNLVAQEQQYRQILKTAQRIEDVVHVTEKIDAVRVEIDQTKAGFEGMKHDIAMSSVDISIVRDGNERGFSNWRPIREMRQAGRNLIDGLIGYANAGIAVVFYLPILLLWLVSLAAISIIVVRILRRIWQYLRPLYG
jgi:hypothetical protein